MTTIDAAVLSGMPNNCIKFLKINPMYAEMYARQYAPGIRRAYRILNAMRSARPLLGPTDRPLWPSQFECLEAQLGLA
jgi:hypothetical protein